MEDSVYKQHRKTFVNATMVTMDKAFTIVENGFIQVDGHKITRIGAGMPEDLEHGIDLKGAIVLPGFINAHTHLPMVMYRGMADDLPLKTWLEQHIWPAEAKHSHAENIAKATRLGLAELIKTGTTTFADMYFFADTVACETVKAGLRGVMNESLIDFATNSYKNTHEAFNLVESFTHKWDGHDLIYPALNLHSTYTCSEPLLKRALALLKHKAMPVQIHLNETQHEVELLIEKTGKTPIHYFHSLGFFDHKVLAAHCVWPTDHDLKLMQHPNFSVAHCPTSNLKLGSGIAPVPKMMDAGINIALGTDGCASNNNLDMVEEARLAALLHKGVNHNPTLVTSRQALLMATINGAKALGLDDKIGSLEVGKMADFMVINRKNTFMNPVYDYYSAIVYAMNSGNIDSVIVNGKPLMVNKALQTLDLAEIISEIKPFKP